jgi:hypothetical protein
VFEKDIVMKVKGIERTAENEKMKVTDKPCPSGER